MKTVYFYDNYGKLHQVNYLPDTTMKEIEQDLIHCFGCEVQIIGYEFN